MFARFKLLVRLIEDEVPLNIISIEDEFILKRVFGLSNIKSISFSTTYDYYKVNVIIGINKEEYRKLLETKGIYDGTSEEQDSLAETSRITNLLLSNEHRIFSELYILNTNKQLLLSYDPPEIMTPAEERAMQGDLGVPIYLLKENLKNQCKLPATRAARISAKYDATNIQNNQ
ncbi:hypothetical protein NEOKW01_0212 [Nematocida sp. AWRm80]|nr:hypothetical protein NEOKW01_0212 [Nematocida sp. AWRm80]